MSICSDQYISRKKAREMVLNRLMNKQRELVENAVKGMADHELTSILNEDSDLYFYEIDEDL
jgi:hypothetical protein